MAEQNKVRDMYFNQHLSISRIKSITGYDRKTVRKYINKEATSTKPIKVTKTSTSKIDPYKVEIDSWLDEDRNARRKQRHTATRVHQRLFEIYGKSLDCSYRTIAKYVSNRKKDLFQNNKSFLPLQHISGEAQVDFGKADFYEKGIKHSGAYLVVSFPYSNAGYLQLFKGENSECLFEGLLNIFNHIGGVPHKLWFDNMSTIVISILKNGERKVTENYQHFHQFFGFSAAFCNPNSGHEKGNVEAKVGYLRRNLLVPIPNFENIEEYNKLLLEQCDNNLDRPHYSKELLIKNLFEEDKNALIHLPKNEYEVAKYERVKTDSYGKFTLNLGKHIYSTAPKHAKTYVLVKITANKVIPLNEDFVEIISHKRMYGNKRQESMKWIPYLTQLSQRPRALKYSGIYDLFPDTVKSIFDNTKNHSEILKSMVDISNKSNFEMSLRVLETALLHNKFDKESLKAIHNRLVNGNIELPAIKLPKNTPKVDVYPINLSTYDEAFLPGDDNLC